MTHTPELKPCPFCGGDAELDTMQGYRALSGGHLGNRATVYCTRCGADMGFCYEDAPGTPSEDIVNQVVDDWNRRAVNSLPALVKALEALGFGSEEKIGWRGTHPIPSTIAHFRCEFCAAESLNCDEIAHSAECPVTICRAALASHKTGG